MALLDCMRMLAAEDVPEAVERTWEYFTAGGVFMALIVCCSLVSLMVIIYKALTLTRARVLPEGLAGEVERIEMHLRAGEHRRLQEQFQEGETALARLCGVAVKNSHRSPAEAQEAVQSSAREEVVKMHAGLTVLDVMITIAPLLGLLGTASGLVVIFGSTEELVSGANNAKIGAGIARALGTTIAGLVVAVPSVVAHGYFTRKIETMAARLEVLLGIVVPACQLHLRGERREEAPAGEPTRVPSSFTPIPK